MNTSKLLDLLTDTTRLHNTYVERQLTQHGIHSGQGYIISALDILGPCSQKELADFRQVSPATISVMLGRMENKGLIRRVPADSGGKRNQILLTPDGEELAMALRDIMPQEADKIFDGLTSDELAVADRVFRVICHNLKPS